ncbi:glycosyltransferase [Flavobacterium macacae]|uniref:Glycosyl transferase family 1 domain-containing protein n=1 Tax=Flavobacterium macacae TaxID=2488993 RepID=A0A3P3W736_9FLAO|nr:glycosyltransferase [Flavobacterium macacae]RRJ88483.1 hypothetical protein EG849_14475 [Flavobacterium macacae]
MVLIDALYINNGGGKILLDYLVKEIEGKNINAYYLFDLRCINDFQFIPTHRKIYLRASLIKRHQFYKKNLNLFTKVFCFGNLPPTIKLNIPVFTYFHNRLFLKIPQNLKFKTQVFLKLKFFIFKLLIKNTDYIILQSNVIKEEFLKLINIDSSKVLVLPFYEPIKYSNSIKVKHSFIYVSSGIEYKNHKRLLDAFTMVYDFTKKGSLILTIDDSYIDLYNEIKLLIDRGYPIINLGFAKKELLAREYSKAEFAIYPSLTESLGLGVVEAIEGGCDVIGADLPYLHAICQPSLVFDPLSVDSIKNSIIFAINHILPNTEQKLFNEVNKIISLLK